MPSNLPRWYNFRQIYAALVEVHEISTAIEDISTKLSILSEHQQEQRQHRNNSVTRIITVFGFVSILASMLTIIQILTGGSPLEWITMISTIFALLLITCISLIIKKSNFGSDFCKEEKIAHLSQKPRPRRALFPFLIQAVCPLNFSEKFHFSRQKAASLFFVRQLP